jgi:trehalose-6-phosphate synthase
MHFRLESSHWWLLAADTTIWPLFHYQLDKVSFNVEAFAAYETANKAFADTIASDLKDGDQVWIHDIHLMLLPLLLRQRAQKMNINIKIGWFLHTPFPAKEFFDTLPFRNEILDGILGADVVGFQTDEDRRHFSNACSDILWVHHPTHTIRE